VNLAERLGYATDARLVVLHSDDMACSRAADAATFELMEAGRLTSGSVIVPAPYLGEVAAYQRSHPKADIGVHLALTSEHPKRRWTGVLGRTATPTLHDADGYLPMTVEEVVQRADPEEAARELRAQVEKALSVGIDVTHLDSHMGALFYRQFLSAWTALAVEFKLPTFLAAGWRGRPAVQAMEAAGVPVLDDLIYDTYGPGRPEKEILYRQLFDDLGPGFTHFLIHPAHDTPELWEYIVGPETRIADYGIFAEGSVHARLDEAGVRLVGHRVLRDAIRSWSLVAV
jgi:chitin disaccharide deacetylase